ncbi:hypothetical protein CSUI_011369, partial [Cystoisospora suis]
MEPEAALTGISCAVISAVVQGRKRRGVSETQPGLRGDSCSEGNLSNSPLSHHRQCGEEQRSSEVSTGNQSAIISSLHNSLKKGQERGSRSAPSARASRNRVNGATEKGLVRPADRTQTLRYSLRKRGKPEQRFLSAGGHASSDFGRRAQSTTSRARLYKAPKQKRGTVSLSRQAGTLRDLRRRRAHPSVSLEGYEGEKNKTPQRLDLLGDADESKSPVCARTRSQQEASFPASHEDGSSSSKSHEKLMLCSGRPRNSPLTRDNGVHTGWERHAGELPCGFTVGGGESPPFRAEEPQYFLRNRGKLGESPYSDGRRNLFDSLEKPVITSFGRGVQVSSVRVLRALRRCDDGLKAGQRLRPGTGKERKVTGLDYKLMKRKKRTPCCERTSLQRGSPEGKKEGPTEVTIPDTSRRRRRCSLFAGQELDTRESSAVTPTEACHSGKAGIQVSVVDDLKMKDAFCSPPGDDAADLYGRRHGGHSRFLPQLADGSGVEGETAGEPKKTRGWDDCGRRSRTKDIERMRCRTPAASRQTEKTAEEALEDESKGDDTEDRSKTTDGAAEGTSGIEGHETEAWQRLQRRAEDRGRSRLLTRKRLTRSAQTVISKDERDETEEVTDAERGIAGEKAAPGETLTGQRSFRGRRRVESRLQIREAASEEQAGAPVSSEEQNSSTVGGRRQEDTVDEAGDQERQETPLENSGEQEGCCEGGEEFKCSSGGRVCEGNILGNEKNREDSPNEGDEEQKPAHKKDHEREGDVEKVCFKAGQTSEAGARTRDVVQDSMGVGEDRQERDPPEENAKPGRPPCETGRWHLRPRRQKAGTPVNTSCNASSSSVTGATAILSGSSEGEGRLDERNVTNVSTSRRNVTSSTACTSGTGVSCPEDRGVRGTSEPSCAGPVPEGPGQHTYQETVSNEKVRQHGSLEDAPDSCSDTVCHNGNRKRRQCEEETARAQTLAEKNSLLSALQVGTLGSQRSKEEKTKADAEVTSKRLRRRGREDVRGIRVQKPVLAATVCGGSNDMQTESRAPDDTVESRRKVDRGPESRGGQRGRSGGEETLGKRREDGRGKSEELKAELTVPEKETPVHVDKGKEETLGPRIVRQDNEHLVFHCAAGDSPRPSRLLSYSPPSPVSGLLPKAEPSACFAAWCSLLPTSTTDATRSGCVDLPSENP